MVERFKALNFLHRIIRSLFIPSIFQMTGELKELEEKWFQPDNKACQVEKNKKWTEVKKKYLQGVQGVFFHMTFQHFATSSWPALECCCQWFRKWHANIYSLGRKFCRQILSVCDALYPPHWHYVGEVVGTVETLFQQRFMVNRAYCGQTHFSQNTLH